MSFVEVTADTLDEAYANPDHLAWLERGRELARTDSDQRWAVGDWINEGFARWDRSAYDEAAKIFQNYSRGTLILYACVARRVESLIRINDLSWSHHRVVEKFPQNLQQAYLNQAKICGSRCLALKRGSAQASS
jgi:hypothetical protein